MSFKNMSAFKIGLRSLQNIRQVNSRLSRVVCTSRNSLNHQVKSTPISTTTQLFANSKPIDQLFLNDRNFNSYFNNNKRSFSTTPEQKQTSNEKEKETLIEKESKTNVSANKDTTIENTTNNTNNSVTPKESENPTPKSTPRSNQNLVPVSWPAVVLYFITGGVVIFFFLREKQKADEKYKEKVSKSVGAARIGGPFTLVDHNGNPVTDADFRGKFLFIYFGFTNCPDICPTELNLQNDVLNNLEKTNPGITSKIQPIFISVDPLRDTVDVVHEYIQDFHPSLIGLTGSPQQVERVCKAYRVYFTKAYTSLGEQKNDDYLVDHSIILYFMDPEGHYLEYFGTSMSHQEIERRIKNHVKGKGSMEIIKEWFEELWARF